MREVLVIAACCLLAGTVVAGPDRALDLATRPREGRLGEQLSGATRYMQPIGPAGQQNRRVLELGTAEEPDNYIYVEDLEELVSIDAPGLELEYGDAVEGYVPDSYSAAPSYADPSLLSQVMYQAEQANFRFPIATTKPPRTDLDTAASSLDRPETNEINPFSLFPPQFHELLNIPLHVYKNGSSFNPHSNHKNGPRVPVIHQGYANTNVQGGSAYRPSIQDTPVVAYRPKPVYAPKRSKTKPTIITTTTTTTTSTTTTTTEKPRNPTYIHQTTTTRPTTLTTPELTTTTPKPTTTEKTIPITKQETKPTKIPRLPPLRYTRRPTLYSTTPKSFTPFDFPTSRPISLAPTRTNVPDIPDRPRPESRPVIIPETRHPVTINTQQPSVTKTRQPEILHSITPETHRPFIPETHRPFIPETHRPFIPETRHPEILHSVAPETRRPFLPETRRPVILETQVPISSKPIMENTKDESEPVQFIPSKPDPFSINPPPVPVPVPIRPEIENGPESLPPVVNTFNDISETKPQPPAHIIPPAPAPAPLPVADALVTQPPAPINPPPAPLNPAFKLPPNRPQQPPNRPQQPPNRPQQPPNRPQQPPNRPQQPPNRPQQPPNRPQPPPNRPQPPQGQEEFLVRPLHVNAIRPPPPLPQRPVFPPAPLGSPAPHPPRPEHQPPRLSNSNPWASRPPHPDVRPPPFQVIPPANSAPVHTLNRPIAANSDSPFTLPNEAENLPPVRNINNNTPPQLQNPTGPNVLPQFRPNAPPQNENFGISATPSRRRVFNTRRRTRPHLSKRPSFLERFNFFGGSEPVNRRKGETGMMIDTNSATNKVPKKPEVVVPQYKYKHSSDVLSGNAQKVVVLGPFDKPPPGAPLIKLPDSSLAPPPSLVPAVPSNPPTPPHHFHLNQKPPMNKKEFHIPTVQKKPPVPATTDVAPPPLPPQPLIQSDSRDAAVSVDSIKNVKKPSSTVVYGIPVNPDTHTIQSNKAETKVSSNFKVINMKKEENHVVTTPVQTSNSITRAQRPQILVDEVTDEDKAAIIAGKINFPPSIQRSDQPIIPVPVPIINPQFRIKQKRFRPVALHRQGQAAQRRVISVDTPAQQERLKSPPKHLLRHPNTAVRPATSGPATFMRPPPPPPKNPFHPKPFSVRVPPQPSLNAKHPIPPPPPKSPPPPPPTRPTASQSTSSNQSPALTIPKKNVYRKSTSVQDSPRPVYVRSTTMKPITTTKKQPEPISIITSAQTVPFITTERSTPMRVTEYNPYGTQRTKPHTPGSFKEPVIPEASYGGWKVVGAPSVPKEGESLSPVVGYVKENTPEIIIKSDIVEDDHSDIVTGIASDRMGIAPPDNSDLVQYSSRLNIEAPGVVRSYWVPPPKHIN